MASQNSDAIITIDDTPYEDIDLSKDEQEALISAFKCLIDTTIYSNILYKNNQHIRYMYVIYKHLVHETTVLY
jgi:hypothetical protein